MKLASVTCWWCRGAHSVKDCPTYYKEACVQKDLSRFDWWFAVGVGLAVAAAASWIGLYVVTR